MEFYQLLWANHELFGDKQPVIGILRDYYTNLFADIIYEHTKNKYGFDANGSPVVDE